MRKNETKEEKRRKIWHFFWLENVLEEIFLGNEGRWVNS